MANHMKNQNEVKVIASDKMTPMLIALRPVAPPLLLFPPPLLLFPNPPPITCVY